MDYFVMAFYIIIIHGYLKVPIAAGIVQRYQTPLVLGVDISAMSEKQLDNSGPVVASCKVQRRRLPSITGVAVHIEGGQ